MPFVFKISGLVPGFLAAIITSFVCSHCSYILVSDRILSSNLRVLTDHYRLLGEMCSYSLQTNEYILTDICRCCWNRICKRTKKPTVFSAIRSPLCNNQFVCHIFWFLQRLCGHHWWQHKTNVPILYGHWSQHSPLHYCISTAAHPVDINSKFKVFGSRFDAGQYMYGNWLRHNRLLFLKWFARI